MMITPQLSCGWKKRKCNGNWEEVARIDAQSVSEMWVDEARELNRIEWNVRWRLCDKLWQWNYYLFLCYDSTIVYIVSISDKINIEPSSPFDFLSVVILGERREICLFSSSGIVVTNFYYIINELREQTEKMGK